MWWQHPFQELPAGLLSAAIFAFLSYIYAVFSPQVKQAVPAPWSFVVIVVGPLVLAGFFLLIWNQVEVSLDRHQQERLRHPTPDLLESTVREVLFRNGFTITNAPDAHTTFSISVRDAGGHNFVIFQRRDTPGYVGIAARLVATEDQQRKLDPFLAPPRSPLLREIRMELYKFGIAFDGVVYPLRVVALIDFVPYSDVISEPTLLNRIMFVRRALGLLNEILVRAIE